MAMNLMKNRDQLLTSCRWFQMTTLWFLLLNMAMWHGQVYAYSVEDAERLVQEKTANISASFRPLYDQSHVLSISAQFNLVSIQEFDEVLSKITITGQLTLGWTDERFTWNPSDYGGVTEVVVDGAKIWKPFMVLANSADGMDKVNYDWHLLSVDHTGRVTYKPGATFSSTCNVDITYYPWDRQACGFMFYPFGYDSGSYVSFTAPNDKIMMPYYTENGLWELADTSVTPIPYSALVYFKIVLDRKPRFVVVNVVLPVIFMAMLNVLIFTIPAESGERISFSLTVLLAIALFLTLVNDNLPKTSSPMSFCSYYLLSMLTIGVCTTLVTLFSLHIYHKDSNAKVGKFWRYVARFVGCKCRRIKCRRRRNVTDVLPVKQGHPDDNMNHETVGQKWANPLLNEKSKGAELGISHSNMWTTGQSTDPKKRQNNPNPSETGYTLYASDESDATSASGSDVYEDEENLTWQDISVAVDKIAFVFFILVLLVNTSVFMGLIYRGTYTVQDELFS